MVRVGIVACLGLMVGACAPANQERVRDYTQDALELFQRGKYADARDSFQAALALRPADANLRFNIGQCSEQIGKYAQAERSYQQCLQVDPNNLDCRFALTALLVRENRRTEASQMVDEWMAQRPRLAGPYAVDGWLWRQAGDWPRAQSRLQYALALDPNNVLALTELGQVYESLHRPDRACVLYEHALNVKPDQPAVRARLVALRSEGASRPRPD